MKAKTILDTEKNEAIEIAEQLCYGKEVMQKIMRAESVYEISRIFETSETQSRMIFLKGENHAEN